MTMDSEASSGVSTPASTFSSPSGLPTSAPSSPPTVRSPSTKTIAAPVIHLSRLDEEEEKARRANETAESKRQVAAQKRKRKSASRAERIKKAKELDLLLQQTAAFSQILTKKTQALGRVGTALDGKALGEHKLEMAKQPACMTGGTMRDYQLEGLTWMYEICQQGMSGILADEMGLGKTVQTISLIALLREQEQYYGPHLIVAPLSTLSNWLDEFQRWTPSIPVLMYHGTPTERRDLWQKDVMRHYKDRRPNEKFPVICTSYEVVLRDKAFLAKVNWEFIIIDEGHRMKNFDSKLFRELKMFSSATRLLITGTPLQNSLRELWSLLNFLLPTIFTDWDAFDTWFDFSDLQDVEGTEKFISDGEKHDLVKRIHVVLQPLLLRRVKADVASYLPKKREYVLYAPMTKEQTDLYKAINDKTVDTRDFLQRRVAEQLSASPSPRMSSSRVAPLKKEESPVAKESSSRKFPIRQSPRKSASTTSLGTGTKTNGGGLKNAFSLMMKKPTTPTTTPKSTTATLKSEGTKRKTAPTEEVLESKSPRTSPDSTPATSRGGSRSRRRVAYREAEPDDEDKMSDDEFESNLVKEIQERELAELEAEQSSEVFGLAATLELAKKEISNKKLGNPLMQLRLVCNSPHNFYNPWASGEVAVDERVVTESGKMLLLDRLLPGLFERNHKVLIFSQFKTQLDILESYCELRNLRGCRLDGSVPQDDRRSMIAEFNSNPEMKVFLLSTRAGGQGINLMAADTVILFDSDWNPQQDLQAQDRCHRIGQTRPVVVFRFATKGTVEEDLLSSADAKRRLEKLVIKKGNLKTMSRSVGTGQEEKLDKEVLRSLLLKDGEVFKYSGDKEILSDEDIELLCDRSDEAYERASRGAGNAKGYKVVETGADGIQEVGKSQ